MAYEPNLQQRDKLLLYRLCHCHRSVSVKFEARRHGIAFSTMRNRLNQLSGARWLSRLRVRAIEPAPISEPIFEFEPGDNPLPNFYAIAELARKRWEGLLEREMWIYVAGDRALRRAGLPARKRYELRHHASHDLAMASVFEWAERVYPDLEFIGEDIFEPRGFGVGVEDAFLGDGDEIVRVIEHAGRYRRERVIHFHQHVAEERQLPYSLF